MAKSDGVPPQDISDEGSVRIYGQILGDLKRSWYEGDREDQAGGPELKARSRHHYPYKEIKRVVASNRVNHRGGYTEIAVLGPLELRVEGRKRPLPPPAARRLLIYLALEGGAPSRETLAALLWPGMATDRSRLRLSQALHQLKAALGRQGCHTLLIENDAIGLDRAKVWVDAHTWRALAASGQAEDRLQALALVRGNLWEHNDKTNSRWSAWVGEQALGLQSLGADLFARSIADARSQGALAQAQDIARQWVVFSPFSEPAHLTLMQVLVDSGLKNAALAHCDLFSRRLAEEHGQKPGEAIQNLRRDLQNNKSPLSLSPVAEGTAAGFRKGAVAVLACHLQKTHESTETLVIRHYPLILEMARMFGGVSLLNPNGSIEIRFHDKEDGSRRAAESALRIRAALDHGVMAGYGIHCGTMLTTHEPYPQIMGDISRMAHELALHSAGHILISETSRDRVTTLFNSLPLEKPIGGLCAFRLVSTHSPSHHPETLRTFGRTLEEKALHSAWGRTRKTGRGNVIHIHGEPGIGKTHLIRQFCQNLAQNTIVRHFRCVPEHQRSVLGPMEDVIRDLLGGPERLNFGYQELAIKLREKGITDSWLLKIWAAWLGISAPGARIDEALLTRDYKEILHESILDVLANGLASTPRIVVVDDVQWADSSSMEILSLFIKRIERVPCLVILASRDRNILRVTASTPMIDLPLKALSLEATEQLAFEIAPESPVAVRRAIAERSAGTPLFAKTIAALAHNVIDAKTLLPNTLQEILVARIYGLGKAASSLAQAAAILGQSCQVDHLARLYCVPDNEFSLALSALEDGGIVTATGDAALRFAHALYFDAIVSTIPAEQKRTWHQSAAVLLSQDSRWSAAHPERVAEHFYLGGVMSEACAYWQVAARRAATLLIPKAAFQYLRSALDALNELPEQEEFWRQELSLRCDYMAISWGVEGFASKPVRANLSRLLALCEEHKVTGPQRYLALRGAWLDAFGYGDMREAECAANALAAAASECEDARFGIVAGRFAQAVSLLWQGKIVDSATLSEDGIRQCLPEFHVMSCRLLGEDVTVSLRAYRTISNLMRGLAQESESEIEALWEETEKAAIPAYIAYVLVIYGALCFFARDVARGARAIVRLEQVCAAGSLELWDTVATIYRAWINAESGQWTEDSARDLDAAIQRIGAIWRSGLSFCSTIQCAALLAVGDRRFPEAMRVARNLVDTTGAFLMLPDLLLQEGIWYQRFSEAHAQELSAKQLASAEILATQQGNTLFAIRAQKARSGAPQYPNTREPRSNGRGNMGDY